MFKASLPCTSEILGNSSPVLLALGEQVVELLLGLAAFFVGGLHGGNGLGSALEVLFLKTADDTVGFFIDKFKC